MRNEGERKLKKVYKRGDVVTFRLLKKQQYSDDVLELLNKANENDALNIEIIEALKLYSEFKKSGKSLDSIISSSEQDIEIIKDIEEDEIFGMMSSTIKPVEDNQKESKKVISIEKYSMLGQEDAADEIFSDPKESNKQDDLGNKNKLNRAFKSLRRNI